MRIEMLVHRKVNPSISIGFPNGSLVMTHLYPRVKRGNVEKSSCVRAETTTWCKRSPYFNVIWLFLCVARSVGGGGGLRKRGETKEAPHNFAWTSAPDYRTKGLGRVRDSRASIHVSEEKTSLWSKISLVKPLSKFKKLLVPFWWWMFHLDIQNPLTFTSLNIRAPFTEKSKAKETVSEIHKLLRKLSTCLQVSY